MYVDPSITKTHEDLAPGLTQYVHDAIHDYVDRHERASGRPSDTGGVVGLA